MEELPTTIELVRDAVHAADRAKAKIVEAEQSLARAKIEHAEAEARLAAIIAGGACTKENGCNHPHGAMPAKPPIALEDTKIPIVWRIAFMLLENPVLDYQETARRLWGMTTPTTAKNRVNGHVTRLRNLGVAETLGANRFAIDRARLAELSGLPVEEVPNQ